MSPALKNRLVGTIIIVAIAVIFLPDLLDGKKETKRNLFVELPSKPDMKKVKAPTEFNIGKVQEAATRKVEVISEQAVDEPVKNEPAVLANNSDQPVVDVKIPDEVDKPASTLAQQTVIEVDKSQIVNKAGWVVQLGSFRHQKNVKELLSQLEKSGYRAFSRPVKTKSGTLTKVFVGPDLDKKKLTDALSHLKVLTDLQGKVTPFTVR